MRGKFLVIVAVALGALVVFMINSQFQAYEAKANPKTRKFWRATGDIAPGLTVDAVMQDNRRLLQPTTDLPEAFAMAYPDAVDDSRIDSVKDQVISRPLKAGEFLQMKDLAPLSAADMRASIPEGKVAVSISVSAQTSVGYLIAPGDVVDVYVTSTHQDPAAPGGVAVTATVAVGDLTVHAIDNIVARPDGVPVRPRGAAYQTVTVVATPEDAGKLIAALTRGKATLALKGKKKAT